MEPIMIQVTKDQFASSKEARRNGRVPIVYYSKEVKPINFSADYQDFRRAYKKAGKSAIITLIDENKEEHQAIAHELQYHPVSDDIMHVDLIAIKKGQKISTEIPIKFVGEAPAVREMGGTFYASKGVVTVECLPKDLPHEIEVDISGLVDFNIQLTVADINVPEEISILDSDEITLASIYAPREEEEPETTEAGEGEAATEGKKEGEEAGEANKKQGEGESKSE